LLPDHARAPAVADPRRDPGDVHRPGRAVRERRAPGDHPFDAALGRCRRAARAARLQGRVHGDRADRGVPADRPGEEERDHDGRFRARRQRAGDKPPEQAIFEACLLRFRPIMMTTMAAILGALPLVLRRGDGAELRQPLGIAIVGGLILSQLLTLYTTPVVYLYLDRFRLWSKRLMQRRQPQAS